MGKCAIHINQVYKQFPNSSRNAVDGVSAEIEEGSFVTIMGTSGSGKTTLLKMINRIYEASSGDIVFYGQNIKSLKVEDYRKQIGYVIQQIGLFPHMTVAENIATVPKILKWSKSRISQRVDELLELVHLPPGDYRNRYPRQLSGGQQQRVGLARAMAADPAVMLMDEPFGAIDAITRQTLQNELLAIQKKLGKTILFVTHDIHEAFKLGDKTIIMHEGQIQQYDTPYNILFNPANSYVEKLVSSEDILERLRVLRAQTIAAPLTGRPDCHAVVICKDEPLHHVLGYFIEQGLSCVFVADEKQQVIGQITWDRFKVISAFCKVPPEEKQPVAKTPETAAGQTVKELAHYA